MTYPEFKIGIIGCGLIGQKRANNLGKNAKLVALADLNLENAKKVAGISNIALFQDWRQLIKEADLDIIIIATLHDSLAAITLAAIESGKHVLVEKPAARTPSELEPIIHAAERHQVKVHVGFNHRYHRAMRKAKTMIDEGLIGDLMYIRARYGHGGRLGYEKEWRANRDLSGGGELIDQGPHVIDLSRWFLGEFTKVQGFAKTYYWDMPVDDNAFMLLQTAKGQTAFLHVSCTEWKNTFAMEIMGAKGKLEITGLGGSYGVERLSHYHMLQEMGPPETIIYEYPMADDSWACELEEFYADIRENRVVSSSLSDAYKTLKIIQEIYKEA
ncbi:MAG: LmbZ [Legionellales bacterium RIFCSPHIGHO2_12_FULL_37_14]|nr:MAG: LmbZ [Legionellales bacterium RIFCSPHIGHO2_12_FULL_37_14]